MKTIMQAEDVGKALKEISDEKGMIPRKVNQLMEIAFPTKRPLSFKEEKIMRHYFGKEYRWTHIGADGNIILVNKDAVADMGFAYITEQDLKDEVARNRVK